MFLKSVTELAIDFRDVRAAILSDPRGWLAGLAEAAGEDGDRLLVNVGLAVGGQELGQVGRLEVGEAMATDRVAMLPLHLRAVDDARLFPSLEGSLEAGWLGHGRTHLAVSAMYEPPFGLADKAVDRTLLHRVTEAVVQRFLEAIAHELTASCQPDSRRGPDPGPGRECGRTLVMACSTRGLLEPSGPTRIRNRQVRWNSIRTAADLFVKDDLVAGQPLPCCERDELQDG